MSRFAHTARFAEVCTPDEVGTHAKRFMDAAVPKTATAAQTSEESSLSRGPDLHVAFACRRRFSIKPVLFVG